MAELHSAAVILTTTICFVCNWKKIPKSLSIYQFFSILINTSPSFFCSAKIAGAFVPIFLFFVFPRFTARPAAFIPPIRRTVTRGGFNWIWDYTEKKTNLLLMNSHYINKFWKKKRLSKMMQKVNQDLTFSNQISLKKNWILLKVRKRRGIGEGGKGLAWLLNSDVFVWLLCKGGDYC